MNEIQKTIVEVIESFCTPLEINLHADQLSVTVNQTDIINLAKELKSNSKTSFDMLTDITAIDWLKKGDRYEVVYFLYSNHFKSRLRLKVPVDEKQPHCPSVTEIWESANWYERETYDMYGIIFQGHPNLRRFYMPEDFLDPETKEPLHPLRKDFPLMGIPNSLPLPPYPERYGKVSEN